MKQKGETTITDIMMAVEAKKKVHHRHPWRRRLIALGSLLALIAPFALPLALIGGGVGTVMHDLSRNPYLNIENEVDNYYATAEYHIPVVQDDMAQLAKTHALGNQYLLYLYAWNTEIVTRKNPQYATATYDLYIRSNGRTTSSYRLTVTLSIMSDGRHWRILTINRST